MSAGSVTRPVIVAWDSSQGARDAVTWAARAAERLHRPLRIVYVSNLVQPSYNSEPMTLFPQELTNEQIDQILTPARELAQATAPDVPVEATCLVGNPVAELVEQSGEAELLVIGSRGHSRFIATLTGSTGVSVASHGRGPVVVVRDLPAAEAHAPVVVGVDGSATSAEAVAFAARYADAVGAPLHAVGALPESPLGAAELPLPPEYFTEMRERTDAQLHEALGGIRSDYPDLQVHTTVADELPAQALVERAAGAALLVVGSRGRGGFAGMLLGSISRAALFAAPCPVAVVRPAS